MIRFRISHQAFDGRDLHEFYNRFSDPLFRTVAKIAQEAGGERPANVRVCYREPQPFQSPFVVQPKQGVVHPRSEGAFKASAWLAKWISIARIDPPDKRLSRCPAYHWALKVRGG